MSTITYLKNLIQDKNIASVTPTSSFGVERICKRIDFATAMVIVEYGPGTGVFSKRLLEYMHPEAKLLLIETNQRFCRLLSQTYKDPRVSIHNRSAEDILDILAENQLEAADVIISGIPFSFFPTELKDRILTRTNKALSREGRFFVYQFLFSLSGSSNDIRKKLAEHLQLLRSEYELRCVPPLRIYESKATPKG